MIPKREQVRKKELATYFVTSVTWQRRALFRARPFAELFLRVLEGYRGENYLLHEYVLMPDHFHLLLSPLQTIERAVQKIKGGFSYRVKRDLGAGTEIWQRSFTDHRVRDAEDYAKHREYLLANPVRARLCSQAVEYEYSSASRRLDAFPPRLKPMDEAEDVRHG